MTKDKDQGNKQAKNRPDGDDMPTRVDTAKSGNNAASSTRLPNSAPVDVGARAKSGSSSLSNNKKPTRKLDSTGADGHLQQLDNIMKAIQSIDKKVESNSKLIQSVDKQQKRIGAIMDQP